MSLPREIEDFKEVVPEIVDEPIYVGTCRHEQKWQTCDECNDDYCKECWNLHEGRCQE